MGNITGNMVNAKQSRTVSEMQDEISTKLSSECKPASCTNSSTGAIKIGYVGSGCDFKATQTCKADANCIISNALDVVAKQIKADKVTGDIGEGNGMVDISKTDNITSIKKKLSTAVDNVCGGASASNYSNRPVDISVCEGKFDMSQMGDAKSSCAINSLAKIASESTKNDDTDMTDYGNIAIIAMLAAAGLIGLVIFVKVMKSKSSIAAGLMPPMPMQMPQFIPIPMPAAAPAALPAAPNAAANL